MTYRQERETQPEELVMDVTTIHHIVLVAAVVVIGAIAWFAFGGFKG